MIFQRGSLSKEVSGTCVLYASVSSKPVLYVHGVVRGQGGLSKEDYTVLTYIAIEDNALLRIYHPSQTRGPM